MHPFNNLHRPRGGPGSHTRDIHSKFKRSDKRNTKVRLASQILSYGLSQDTRFHWILFQGTRLHWNSLPRHSNSLEFSSKALGNISIPFKGIRILSNIRHVGHQAPRRAIRLVGHQTPRRAIRPVGHQTPRKAIRLVGHQTPRRAIRPIEHKAPHKTIRPIGHQAPHRTNRPVGYKTSRKIPSTL